VEKARETKQLRYDEKGHSITGYRQNPTASSAQPGSSEGRVAPLLAIKKKGSLRERGYHDRRQRFPDSKLPGIYANGKEIR